MKESNKFVKVDEIKIYGDGIGHVQLYDASYANESEEQRIWTVTTIASLAYGNEEAKNPEALYERMKSIKHESLWEFIRMGREYSSTITSSMRNYDDLRFKENTNFSDIHKTNIACFKIKVPMFVARQFMRHRSFSYLEMSRRYTKGAKVPFEFWYPQELYDNDSFDIKASSEGFIEQYEGHLHYGELETQVASRFLPQTTYTEFYVMCEVEGLRNFMKLRLDSHAQAEIRVVAEAMADLLQDNQYELYTKVVL